MKLSIVIVTYNSAADIGRCLKSVRSHVPDVSYEVMVVDNGSVDETVYIVRTAFPWVHVIVLQDNPGFAAANNVAILQAAGRYLLLLNPDTELAEGAVTAMLSHMERNPGCGLCGPCLINGDGTVAPPIPYPRLAAVFLNGSGLSARVSSRAPAATERVLSGACILIRATVILTVGLLDANMHTQEDVDFCMRARDYGWDVDNVPTAFVTHFIGGSKNVAYVIRRTYESAFLLHKKHTRGAARVCIYTLLSVQIVLRYLKWAALAKRSGASARRQALAALLVRLPSLWRGMPPESAMSACQVASRPQSISFPVGK